VRDIPRRFARPPPRVTPLTLVRTPQEFVEGGFLRLALACVFDGLHALRLSRVVVPKLVYQSFQLFDAFVCHRFRRSDAHRHL
jgi:hypothetical protein